MNNDATSRQLAVGALLSVAVSLLAQGASAAPSETEALTATRVRYDARDLESSAGARRLLQRIDAAALEVCGASAFSLPEVKVAARESVCWRHSVDDAVRSIDSPLLNAAAQRERG